MGENLVMLQDNIASQKAEVQVKIDQLDEGIVQDVAAREEIVTGLSASVIRRYSLLREQRRGIAVVQAKAGSCLGCNMNLPPPAIQHAVPRRRSDYVSALSEDTGTPPGRKIIRLRQKSICGVALLLPSLRRSPATPRSEGAARLAYGAFCCAVTGKRIRSTETSNFSSGQGGQGIARGQGLIRPQTFACES